MSEATVVIESVETKSGTSDKTGKPWTRYDIKDGNGTRYSTFDATSGKLAQSNEGQRFELTFESNQYGNDLKSIKGPITAPAENGQVNPGDGSYIRGKTNPEDQLWITARHAVTEAREALAPSRGEGTTKAFAVEVGILAHAFFNSVISLRHLEHAQNAPAAEAANPQQVADEDIPF